MAGYTKEDNSLASGIPNRTISPETGSFGNATVTNTGDTGEGTNQGAPAGPEDLGRTPEAAGERRSFAAGETTTGAGLSQDGVEPVYQQIADGGDRFDHDKHLGDDKRHKKHD